MPWTVSDAFAIPAFDASAKLVGDEAVISITLATAMGYLLESGAGTDSRTPSCEGQAWAETHLRAKRPCRAVRRRGRTAPQAAPQGSAPGRSGGSERRLPAREQDFS